MGLPAATLTVQLEALPCRQDPLRPSYYSTGRGISYSPGRPLPVPAGVQSSLIIANDVPVDSAAPDLLAISTDRIAVNVTEAAQPVTIKISAQDALIGISSISLGTCR